jgi:Glycine zipper 2TM domain
VTVVKGRRNQRSGGRIWPPLLGVILATSMLAACAAQQPIVTTPRTYQRAGAGAVVGAGAGALIDKDNRWRGAGLGGALGDVLGGSITEISSRAARESVAANQPVAYQSTDGWQRVEAVPQSRAARGCHQVHERVYQDNQLVREQIREVC